MLGALDREFSSYSINTGPGASSSRSQASILLGFPMYAQFQTEFQPQGLAEQPVVPQDIHQTHAIDLIGRPIFFESGQFAGNEAIRAELREIQQADLGRK